MAIFTIRYVQGAFQGNETTEQFMGLGREYSVEVDDKAQTFISAYNHFTNQNLDVTVLLKNESHGGIEFTKEELVSIQDAKILIKDGYPKNGVQIESINQK